MTQSAAEAVTKHRLLVYEALLRMRTARHAGGQITLKNWYLRQGAEMSAEAARVAADYGTQAAARAREIMSRDRSFPGLPG